MKYCILVFFFFILIVCSCETERQLKDVTINKIELYTYPLSDSSGNNWDSSSADSALPDPFIIINESDSASNTDYEFYTYWKTDAEGYVVSYETLLPHTILNPESVYTYALYDYDDSISTSQLMKKISFRFSQYQELSPRELILNSDSLALKFYLTWNYIIK